MKRVVALLVVSFFILGAPCPGGAECDSNSDCDGDEGICVDGECVECEDDDDCDNDETCEDNECEGGGGEGEGEGEGDGDVPTALIAQLCSQFVNCGAQSDFESCNEEGQSFFAQIPPGPPCDDLRAALITFYECAVVQDCAFFEVGPQEGGPCFEEFEFVNNLSSELGDQCLGGGEGEGEGEPPPPPPPETCRESLGAGDGCDCGCFERDPDCGAGGCTQPGCFVEGCNVCWEDEFTPIRCG